MNLLKSFSLKCRYLYRNFCINLIYLFICLLVQQFPKSPKSEKIVEYLSSKPCPNHFLICNKAISFSFLLKFKENKNLIFLIFLP